MAQTANQAEMGFAATEAAVRDALAALRGRLENWGLDADFCGSAELVLAEVLNNIAEHAYGGAGDCADATADARAAACDAGAIGLMCRQGADSVRFILCDRGHALPGLRLPEGRLPANDVALDALPEGGFGWFLIHSLTRDLHYDRIGPENRLSFEIPIAQA